MQSFIHLGSTNCLILKVYCNMIPFIYWKMSGLTVTYLSQCCLALHFKIYLVVPGTSSSKMHYTSKLINFSKVNISISSFIKNFIELFRWKQIKLDFVGGVLDLRTVLFVSLYGLPFHSFHWPKVTKLGIFNILSLYFWEH